MIARLGLASLFIAAAAAADYGRLPLAFEENRGQTDARVRFLARAADHTVFLTGSSAVLRFSGGAIRMRFAGGRPGTIEGAARLPGETNYLGPRRVAGIPRFARVRYRQMWRGIDVVFHEAAGQLEYDFNVAPGADPRAIRIDFEGASRITQDGARIVLHTGAGELRQRAPVIYQDGRPIQGRPLLRGRSVRFEIAAYDHRRPLVIDPVLSYVTRFGARSSIGLVNFQAPPQAPLNGRDRGGTAIAVDAAGNAYVAGSAFTADFPTTPGAFQPSITENPNADPRFTPTNDAFIMKINPAGSALVYSTFLGGTGDDVATGLAIDADGNAYVCGATSSVDFPITPGAFQTNHPVLAGVIRYTGFVAKLNANGSALAYSTYLGGSSTEDVRAIALDSAKNAYVTGVTLSKDFPVTQGAYRSTINFSGAAIAYAAKINDSGSALVYSTFLGDSIILVPPAEPLFVTNAIAVDAAGNAYVGGAANRPDYIVPTPGAYQTQPGSAFVIKLNAAGSAAVFSTFLGAAQGLTGVDAVAVDGAGNVYAAGHTNASNFPTTAGVFEPSVDPAFPNTVSQGRYPPYGFVTKLTPDGSGLIFSTYIGGGGSIIVGAIGVDAKGDVFLAGSADASSFLTTPDAVQPCLGDPYGYSNAFLMKLDPAGSSLLYSTFLGGNVREQGFGLALDASGNAYVSGMADSTDFAPTPGAAGIPGGQAFIAKVDFSTPNPFGVSCVANTASMTPGPVAPGEIVSIFGKGLGPAAPQPGHITNSAFDTSLAGTQVLFDGVAAPLLMVSNYQINAVVPSPVRFRAQTAVRVLVNGKMTPPVTLAVVPLTPAIFTLNGRGTGQGAVLNQDGSINSPTNPAARGSIISVFANSAGFWYPAMGEGIVAPGPVDGNFGFSSVQVNGISQFPTPYFGNAPGEVTALWQINVPVPRNAPTGSYIPIRILASGIANGQRVTIAIK